MIYFDNAASMKPYPETINTMNMVLNECYANPNALHMGGIVAERTVIAARKAILTQLPKSGSLMFTSGATESNAISINNSVKSRTGNKIVTTSYEHPSVRSVIDKSGYEIIKVSPTDNITDYVCENTVMLSMTAVCSETGFINNTADIYNEIKPRFPNCIIHVDAAQGFMKIDNSKIDGDLITISAHKIGGIAGVGALYKKDNTRLKETIRGTEPVALIAAFAKSIKIYDYTLLHDRLINGLNRLNLPINSYNNVKNIVNFSCKVKSEVMLHYLAEHSIYVSSGSACAKGKKSEILPAFGITPKNIDTAIRISFGRHNNIQEIDEFLNILETGIKRWN
ncbi:MAG: aminotransferase class V-fold PLP-dependent enzyme [Oscillospiraceae bacterium]|nr:aminotransferase class V-fold PLP-dependent enzyme [Oscillospiraceae bacterium]